MRARFSQQPEPERLNMQFPPVVTELLHNEFQVPKRCLDCPVLGVHALYRICNDRLSDGIPPNDRSGRALGAKIRAVTSTVLTAYPVGCPGPGPDESTYYAGDIVIGACRSPWINGTSHGLAQADTAPPPDLEPEPL